MTLCTPCYNYEKVDRPSDIKYTPSLGAAQQCGKCGDDSVDERAYMGLHQEDWGVTFSEYQTQASETAFGYANPRNAGTDHDVEMAELFLATAVNGEAGELAEKVKKAVREDDPEYVEEALDEVGDILWYLSQFCSLEGVEFGAIAEGNIEKLLDRQEREQLTGEGDHR